MPFIDSIRINSLFFIAYTPKDSTVLFSVVLLASLKVITNCGVLGLVSAQISSFSQAIKKLTIIIK